MKNENNKILLGTGILNWDRGERVSDRYGSVKLYSSTRSEETLLFDQGEAGQKGRLIARVIKNRKSNHIGDFFHGLFPEMPEVGEEILLGVGKLFFEDDVVGLKPEDGRETFWLDPKKLYRAHFQTVELYFEK